MLLLQHLPLHSLLVRGTVGLGLGELQFETKRDCHIAEVVHFFSFAVGYVAIVKVILQ